MAGRFIIIEGIDGTGKSTLAALIVEALKQQGQRVARTCEPSELPSGRLIIERLATQEYATSAREWLGMFVTDRRNSIDTLVKPALEDGCDVVQDRSMFSTLVYQAAMGIPEDDILRRHEGWHPEPTLLVILDIAPRFGLSRTRRRSLGLGQRWVRQNQQKYLFKDGDAPQSTEKLKFLQEIRRRYLAIRGDYVFRLPVRVKDGDDWRDLSPEELRDRVLDELALRTNPRHAIDERRYLQNDE
jgi:dTMP kinase